MKKAIFIIFLITGISLNAFGQDIGNTKERKISPGGALLRSAFVPGWGQLYNKKYIKSGLFALGEGWLAYGIYDNWKKADRHEKNFKSAIDNPEYQASEFSKYETTRDRRNLKIWIIAATVFYSMFDAYVDAQLADFDQSDKSFEVFIGPGQNDNIMLSLTFNIP